MGRMKELLQSGPPSFAQMQSDYFRWLGYILEAPYQKFGKWQLLKHLHETDFYWTHPMDANRCEDGLLLRDLYLEETGNLSIAVEEFPCSVLEVLVALAMRMDTLLEDGQDPHIADRFWEMMDNLGLDFVNDETYYHEGVQEEVDDILHRMLRREYGRKGRGSLFPLKDSMKHQDKADLWYQLNNYLVDRYYIDGELM